MSTSPPVAGALSVTRTPRARYAWPPLEMAPGASVVTTTGGWTFTSTLEASEPCPNPWVEDWNDCLKMVLEDDGSGSLVSGNYWLVPRYGVAWMRRTADADTWKLRDADWTAD